MGYKPFHLKLVFLLSLKKKESRGWAKKNAQNFYFIPQKWLILDSKVKLEVKTRDQELQNEVLYISVAQSLLEIQQVLKKSEFFKPCIFVKECENCYARL